MLTYGDFLDMNQSLISRSGFLSTTASSALAANAIPSPSPSPVQTKPAMMSPEEIAHERELYKAVAFRFDRERFSAMIGKPYAHRQVTCATSYQSALEALSHMEKTLKVFADPGGFNAGPNATHVAAVFYGSVSYAISLDDAMFAKYPIGLAIDADLHPGDATYTAVWAAIHSNRDAQEYRALVADHDASFLVCNNALSGFAVDIAKRMAGGSSAGVTREQVVAIHDDFSDHFLPGTLLVPAGVAALCAIQEARYTFLPE